MENIKRPTTSSQGAITIGDLISMLESINNPDAPISISTDGGATHSPISLIGDHGGTCLIENSEYLIKKKRRWSFGKLWISMQKESGITESTKPQDHWIARGKVVRGLIKELNTFSNKDSPVEISMDGGVTSYPINYPVLRDGIVIIAAVEKVPGTASNP